MFNPQEKPELNKIQFTNDSFNAMFFQLSKTNKVSTKGKKEGETSISFSCGETLLQKATNKNIKKKLYTNNNKTRKIETHI